MFYVKDSMGNVMCARCGVSGIPMTKDHFIPRACRMPVDGEGNFVAVCEKCNHEKGCSIVLPSWYQYLKEEQKQKLFRYMRYARSYILEKCEDEEILEVVKEL